MFFTLLFPAAEAFADDYHNINGFFGERASGLGGAFTAVSDDPSGAIYNPAGLAFADGTSLSLTASTYRITNKTFEGILGPGQDYSLKAENFIPNFLGALTNLGDLKFGFSLLSPAVETFNQADQIILPLYFPSASQVTAELTDQNTNVQAGPSLAWSLSERFSVGASLFFFTDSSLETFSATVVNFDGSFGQEAQQDSRVTRGFIPVLGLMYMPTDKTSLGLSLRTTLVTSAKRRVSAYTTGAGGSAGSLLASTLATHNLGAGTTNSGIIAIGPAASGKIPETSELRLGWAWFPSQNLMLSADLIYTTGFDEKSDRTEYVPALGVIILTDERDPFLHRRATTNAAFGLEYYLTDNFALRFGLYTNFANSEEIVQRETVISALIAQNLGPLASFGAGIIGAETGSSVVYRNPDLSERPRTEWVNTYGMTLGFSWADANSSIGINLGLESGRGRGIIATELPASSLRYDSLFVYVVASTRR